MLSVRSSVVCLALVTAAFASVTCGGDLALSARGAPYLAAVRTQPPEAPGPQESVRRPVATRAPRPVATTAPSAAPTPPSTPRATQPAPGAVSTPTAAPAPAAPPPAAGAGSRQQDLTNQARASAGLPALAWNACLAGVAQRHANEMAQAGHIFHGDGVQRDLACGLGSTQSGENVGMTSPGIDDNRIFAGFMGSPGHKANIMGPYRYIGTAWVVGADGAGYVSVEFAS